MLSHPILPSWVHMGSPQVLPTLVQFQQQQQPPSQLLENCDVVLHPIFDPVEKAYPAFHNTFELFPLVLV
jgi:hypothetical protein